MGDYCEDCVTKWSRCICKPESDCDNDQNYTVRSQMDSASNVENNRHPIPSDWSDQEDCWNGEAYEKLPFTQHKYQDISNKNGMTIFTHRATGQNLNPRYLLGSHHQDGLKE